MVKMSFRILGCQPKSYIFYLKVSICGTLIEIWWQKFLSPGFKRSKLCILLRSDTLRSSAPGPGLYKEYPFDTKDLFSLYFSSYLECDLKSFFVFRRKVFFWNMSSNLSFLSNFPVNKTDEGLFFYAIIISTFISTLSTAAVRWYEKITWHFCFHIS